MIFLISRRIRKASGKEVTRLEQEKAYNMLLENLTKEF